MEKIILEDYEINRDTVALQPTTHTDYYTIVIERDQILHVKKTPLQLIKQAQKAKSLFQSVQERTSMPSQPTRQKTSNVAGSSTTT